MTKFFTDSLQDKKDWVGDSNNHFIYVCQYRNGAKSRFEGPKNAEYIGTKYIVNLHVWPTRLPK